MAAGLTGGAILAGTQVAGAQSASTAASSSSNANTPPDWTAVSHGPGETLLTGTAARVETDSAGSAYEAHVQKADGSIVTVKLGKDYSVTGTDQGFGAAPQGEAPSPLGN